MARRKTVNTTKIERVDGIPYHDAWVSYQCVNCRQTNYLKVGLELIQPKVAYQSCRWECSYCKFIHSKDTDLPFKNWDKDLLVPGSPANQKFWEYFFLVATEHPDSHWKQCNVCCRILPFQAFSRHVGWGPLERQMECRGCKSAINSILNPKRTKEQLHESSAARRVADLLIASENEPIDFKELFERFGSKCFKTKKHLHLEERGTWAVDHILPSKFLYPLNKANAALLSRAANENKRDKWPSEFYTNSELKELSQLTGANLELISSPKPILNTNIDINSAVERFLIVREGSDLQKRVKALKKIITAYNLAAGLTPANRKILGISKN